MKDAYIKKVKKSLMIPASKRKAVLRDLEEAFASAAEHGETEQQVIARLGTPEQFAALVKLVDDSKVSRNDGKTILRYMMEHPEAPEEIAKKNNFLVVNDMGAVNETIDALLKERADLVEQYLGGEQKVFGFLMGQCTSKLKGVANPRDIKAVLEQKLQALK